MPPLSSEIKTPWRSIITGLLFGLVLAFLHKILLRFGLNQIWYLDRDTQLSGDLLLVMALGLFVLLCLCIWFGLLFIESATMKSRTFQDPELSLVFQKQRTFYRYFLLPPMVFAGGIPLFLAPFVLIVLPTMFSEEKLKRMQCFYLAEKYRTGRVAMKALLIVLSVVLLVSVPMARIQKDVAYYEERGMRGPAASQNATGK